MEEFQIKNGSHQRKLQIQVIFGEIMKSKDISFRDLMNREKRITYLVGVGRSFDYLEIIYLEKQ